MSTGWVDDIAALLDDAAEQMRTAEKLHDEALDNADARSRFKTRVKNVLENQRSALDYLAVGITKEYGTPKGLIYYPLAQSEDEFAAVMERKMPGVTAAQPDIAAAIQRHQPYNNEWLRELSQLTREQKHNQLTLQIVDETYQCRVTEKETGAFVQWRGLHFRLGGMRTFGGTIELHPEPGRKPASPKLLEVDAGPTGVLVFGVPIDPITQRPFPDEHLQVERGPFHQWCFVRPHRPVLNELVTFQTLVRGVVHDVLHADRR